MKQRVLMFFSFVPLAFGATVCLAAAAAFVAEERAQAAWLPTVQPQAAEPQAVRRPTPAECLGGVVETATGKPAADADRGTGRVLDARASLEPKPSETSGPEGARKQPAPAGVAGATPRHGVEADGPEPGTRARDVRFPGPADTTQARLHVPEGIYGQAPPALVHHRGG